MWCRASPPPPRSALDRVYFLRTLAEPDPLPPYPRTDRDPEACDRAIGLSLRVLGGF